MKTKILVHTVAAGLLAFSFMPLVTCQAASEKSTAAPQKKQQGSKAMPPT